MSSRVSVLLETWQALAASRRALPIALVFVAMVAAEWAVTASVLTLGVDLALFSAFVLIMPAVWRVRAKSGVKGLIGYFIVALLLVLTLGFVLPSALGLRGTYVVADEASLGVVLVLVLVGGWGLGRDIELEAGLDAERMRAEHYALAAERAQLLALREQLDPHFLFNTLNAIAEWCREDPKVAEAATLRLASMLRAILDGVRASTWTLGEEMALARGLFELHQLRDRELYQLELDAPDPMPDAHVPPMLFLPLFENAITHGPAKGNHGAIRARLRIVDSANEIELSIENAGAFEGRREGGEGIALVERRLALAYGERAKFSIVRTEEASTRVTLFLPRWPIT